MMFFVTGANGSGKSSVLPHLRANLPEMKWYDFDDSPYEPRGGTIWRQRSTEYWIEKGILHQENDIDTGISGHALIGEILASPAATNLKGIAVLLLDCYDVERIERLRKRESHGADQDNLNWAAWQRMHAVDPKWRIDIIMDNSEVNLIWERWKDWKRGDPRWKVDIVDTTHMSIIQVAEEIKTWVQSKQEEFIKNTLPLSGNWWK